MAVQLLDDFPEKTTSSHKYKEEAQTLRDNPGKVLLIAGGEKNSSLKNRIKRGQLAHFAPAGSFEAESRKTEKGFDIYARFVGEPMLT